VPASLYREDRIIRAEERAFIEVHLAALTQGRRQVAQEARVLYDRWAAAERGSVAWHHHLREYHAATGHCIALMNAWRLWWQEYLLL
jgi:hypothetical protein